MPGEQQHSLYDIRSLDFSNVEHNMHCSIRYFYLLNSDTCINTNPLVRYIAVSNKSGGGGAFGGFGLWYFRGGHAGADADAGAGAGAHEHTFTGIPDVCATYGDADSNGSAPRRNGCTSADGYLNVNPGTTYG